MIFFFKLELLGTSRNNINIFYVCTAQIDCKWKLRLENISGK